MSKSQLPREPAYRLISWAEYGDLVFRLAEKIKSGSYVRIVALATGGLTMSRAIKDYLGIRKLSTLEISFYTGIGEKGKTPIITQSLSSNVEGEDILIFDDINDSGNTLKTAVAYLKLRGATKITTATIFQKPHTLFPSDHFVEETTDWIIYPDEIQETIKELKKIWGKKPKSAVSASLSAIGFSEEHIKHYL